MKIRFFIPVLHILLTIIVLGCQTHPEKNDLQPVTVGITGTYLGEAATFIAHDEGFFDEQGLDVTLTRNQSGSQSIRDLFDGKVDIAHVAETPVVYSIMQSNYYEGELPDFKLFAEMIYSHNIQKIIARKDAGIRQPKDITGKRIGVYSGTQLDYFFDSFLLEHQIPRNSLDIYNMTLDEQARAIVNGEIDVSVTWEPTSTSIQNELGDNALFLTTDLTYSTLWLATTLTSYAEANPGILESYLQALQEAQQFIKDHPAQSREILSSHTGISPDIIYTIWDEIDFELSLSERMLSLLEDQARWMIQNDIADTTRYDMDQFILKEPMQTVHPNGITIIR